MADDLSNDPNQGVMFPALSAAQIARIAPFARERVFADREDLWALGERNRPLFVVVEGGIEIRTGRDHLVTVHEPGGFSGDVDLLSGRPVVVSARAHGATKVLEVPPERVRSLVQTDAELSEIFLRAFLLRRSALMAHGYGNLVLIGSLHCAATLALREFLSRNSQPHSYIDLDLEPDVQATLDGFGVGPGDVPVIICCGGTVLRRPTIPQLGELLGLGRLKQDAVHDLVVIGAGPAGLAAAVYAASEGLDTLVVESSAPGGQAGSSSRIENYLGFPTGISGQDLANAAFVQAEKFGADFALTRTAVRLSCEERPYSVELGAGVAVRTRCVIVASGVQYRRPEIENLSRFEGVGVYYGATPIEAKLCQDDDVIIVGGGNSAGQAAVFLASHGRQVHVLVRRAGLTETMSRYLIRRIEETPNIQLRTRTQIVALHGERRLERVTWEDSARHERQTVDIRHVFLMTGAVPNTSWLGACLSLDDKNFIRTGQDLRPQDLLVARWPLARSPLLFETDHPGVFAVGDVRAGSVKRLAAAVGEGSVCVQLVHRVLAE